MTIDDIMNGDIVGVPTVVLNKETYSVDEVVVEGVVIGFTESGAILEYDSDGETANTIAAEVSPVEMTNEFLKGNGFEEYEWNGSVSLGFMEEEESGLKRRVDVCSDENAHYIIGLDSNYRYIRIDSHNVHDLQHVMHSLGFKKKLKPIYKDNG